MEYGSLSIEPIDFTQLSLENKKENNNHDWTIVHPNFTDELIQK